MNVDNNENQSMVRPPDVPIVPTEPSPLPPMRSQYTGNYKGFCWNAQAYFGTVASVQTSKHEYLWKTMAGKDFGIITETHSTPGKIIGAKQPTGYKCFWSHGSSTQAGVGLVVSHQFLTNFNPVESADWAELEQGRLARLSLKGPQGSLDIFAVYMQSGSDPSNRNARKHSIQILGNNIQPQDSVLSIVCGDFNFVEHNQDRWAKGDGHWTGNRDRVETETFTQISRNRGIHELQQHCFTHECATARSRLDRIYMNNPVSDQLDRVYSCYALPATTISAHRAVVFSRIAPTKTDEQNYIPERVARHPDFGRRVALEFQELRRKDDVRDSPVRQLVLIKRAMHTTAKGVALESAEKLKHGMDDKLGWVLSFIRAAEKVNMTRMAACAKAYPHIATFVAPSNPEARSTRGMWELRGHAVQLARQNITTSMQSLQNNDIPDYQKHKHKEHILVKLKRLLPGACNSVAAIQQEDGSVTDNAEEMAQALRTHWKKVFRAETIDPARSRDWWGVLGHRGETTPPNPAEWRTRRADVKKALRLAGNTTPGPDGIPFQAWRALKQLGVEILLDVARTLEGGRAKEQMQEAFSDVAGEHSFNLGTLVCLPKAPTGEDPDLGVYFKPGDTRPLSIVNCDNRLVASAMRWRWEERLTGYVLPRQQGFLMNRSILKNLVDVENRMVLEAAPDSPAVAIFLDFAAAFPSISHVCLKQSLKRARVPDCVTNAVDALYDGCRCQISLQGQLHEGFEMTTGVRQGCPLSPLLYAVAAEALMDHLESIAPGIFIRAYADDTALITHDFWDVAPRLSAAFEAFAQVSGLKLNKNKSIVIPLSNVALESFQDRKTLAVPAWSDMPAQWSCKYLGYFMGPGKQDQSWTAPFKKFSSRVGMWQDQPLGLFWDIGVHNTFGVSVLGYVAMLESPPEWVQKSVVESYRRVAKGPGGWVTPADLWSLKESFGLGMSIRNISWVALASQARVRHIDAACKPDAEFLQVCGKVKRQIERLSRMMPTWRDWFGRIFCLTLLQAEQYLLRECGGIECLRLSRQTQHSGIQNDTTWKDELQKTVYKFISVRTAPHPVERMRHKLQRWALNDASRHTEVPGSVRQQTPAWSSRRACAYLALLKDLVAPRVHAAVFSLLWNRWSTARRFQRTAPCLFGCALETGQDSIEHYCKCHVTKTIFRTKLNLNATELANIHTFVLVNPKIGTHQKLCLVALVTYGIYSVSNRLRSTGPCSSEQAIDAVMQAIREGVRGHAGATKTLDDCWRRRETTKPLPTPPLHPFEKSLLKYRMMTKPPTERSETRIRLLELAMEAEH